ncbi:MAG: succinylglutamate desuccinylase/aspartoacylase family protein [Asgard group archaeon]|nr:succinylglutamate desuccinylase/aspartoacylase family protein [Asgard group archaeon]
MKEISVGNVIGKEGEIVYGFLDILEHPIGTVERLPVIIAQGLTDGPILWLTGNIHGDEYTGIPVIHNVINSLNLKDLNGTIIAIPSLNPAGSRIRTRYPYYDKKDPNRLFPDGNPFKEKSKSDLLEINKVTVDETKNNDNVDFSVVSEKVVKITSDEEIEKEEIDDPIAKYDDEELYPSIQEQIWKNLFEIMKDSADMLIDLHNAFIKSIPFIFLDRVLYNPEDNQKGVEEAKKLFDKTFQLCKAFGLTIIRETIPKKYIQRKLHRSTSGAALNYLRIPSFTIELGMYLDVEEEVVKAATKGIFNILKVSGMLPGELEKITEVRVVAENEEVRHIGHPRAKHPAIIDLLVKKGDFVKKGDLIAIARDIFGRPLAEDSEIRSEVDGYIFMINEGIIRYPNEEICWIASKDVRPMIDIWPKKK